MYDKQKIENSFSKAIDAANTEGITSKDLGVLFGGLAMSITTEIYHLKGSRVKTTGHEDELAKLQSVLGCLTAKINTAAVDEMAQQIMAAYKAYGAVN